MSKQESAIAFALQDSGLWPYPEFVRLFQKVFTNTATKEEMDKAEKLIAGGMNRKRLAKHYDAINYPETFSNSDGSKQQEAPDVKN